MFCNLMIYIDCPKLPGSLSQLSRITLMIFTHTQCQKVLLLAVLGKAFTGAYICQVWYKRTVESAHPFNQPDKSLTDQQLLDKLSATYTRRLGGVQRARHKEQLRSLGLFSPEQRRLRGGFMAAYSSPWWPLQLVMAALHLLTENMDQVVLGGEHSPELPKLWEN